MTLADTFKAMDELGFKSKTQFNEGMEKIIEYYLKNRVSERRE